MKKTQIISKKIQLFPLGDKNEIDRVYQFIEKGMYAQYRGLNILMGQLTSEFFNNNMKLSEEFKDREKEILLNTNKNICDIDYPTGLDSKSLIVNKVNKDFKTMLKNGFCQGERKSCEYKSTYPLMTRSRDLKISHCHVNYEEFITNLYSRELSVIISWVNNIKFKIIFGNPNKSIDLRLTIRNILEDNYKIKGSTIGIYDNKIMLNLSISVPRKEHKLDDKTVVGVDLGIAIPAMCGINNDMYNRMRIGSVEDFLKVRTQLQAQRRRLQSSLKRAQGGHGRSKKLKALQKYKDKEANYVQTYNHMISKRVVDFAIKNNAKYINIEDLNGFDKKSKILRNWSYYQLQNDIKYKARLNGIEVRFINPYLTSQTCSKCGNFEEEQRDGRQFECKKCGYVENADFNAARNIAMSKKFVKLKKDEENLEDDCIKKEHDEVNPMAVVTI